MLNMLRLLFAPEAARVLWRRTRASAMGLAAVLWLGACAAPTPDSDADAPTDAEIYARAEQLYRQGQHGEALRLVAPLAQRGEPKAQYVVGYMYYYGLGVTANERFALAWIGSAAQAGYPPAVRAARALSEQRRQAQSESAEPEAAPTPSPVISAAEAGDVIDLRPPEVREAAPVVTVPDTPLLAVEEPQPDVSDISAAAPASEPEPEPSTPESVAVPQGVRDSDWVMNRPPEHYTIQLLSGTSRDDAARFIGRHGLVDNAALLQFDRGTQKWYAVFLGDYESLSAARSALDALSPALRAASPWIRRFGSIQALRSGGPGDWVE